MLLEGLESPPKVIHNSCHQETGNFESYNLGLLHLAEDECIYSLSYKQMLLVFY